MTHTDTERLDFLLQFMSIEDAGDVEDYPMVIVEGYTLGDYLTMGKILNDGTFKRLCDFGMDLREVIDKAIDEHGADLEEFFVKG